MFARAYFLYLTSDVLTSAAAWRRMKDKYANIKYSEIRINE